jgi:hypothetical protein
MLLKQSIIAALMASASLALALPAADVVNLAVRDDDYGVEYKRSESPVEMFVCKRGEKYAEPPFLPDTWH